MPDITVCQYFTCNIDMFFPCQMLININSQDGCPARHLCNSNAIITNAEVSVRDLFMMRWE